MINKEKTTLFFSRNIDEQSQEDIKVALNEPIIQHYEKYLGLPSFVGQNKDGVLYSNQRKNMGKNARMEGKAPVSSRKGGHDQGCGPIYSYLLYECF